MERGAIFKLLFSNLRTSKPIVCQKTGKIIGNSDQIELVIDENGHIEGIEVVKRSNFKHIRDYIKWEDIVIFGEDVIIVNTKEVI